MASAIHILNGSPVGGGQLQELSRNVGMVFGVRTYVTPVRLDLDLAFDPSRRQYNSTALLIQLLNSYPGSEEKKVALVSVDLYIPVLTFVFGEAQLDGIAAIVSTHRLSNEFYGMRRDDALMVQRLEKEIVHEAGHTFGLYHCRQFECVMRSSTYVEEIDLKRSALCEACSARLVQIR